MSVAASCAGDGCGLPQSRSGPSGMTDTRRERLEELRRREARKDGIASKFCDQLDGLAGRSDASVTEGATSMAETVAASLDERLLRARGSASVSAYTGTSAARSVASRLSRRTGGSVGPASARTQASDALRSLGGAALLSSSSQDGCQSARGSAGSRAVGGARRLGVEWSVLDRLAAQQHAQDQAKLRQKEHELRQRLKQDLEKQMADGRLRKEREREMEDRFAQRQWRDCAEWKEQEDAKAIERRVLRERERGEWAAQIETQKGMAAEEREREQVEARALQCCIHSDLEADRQRAEERWRQHRQQAQRALEDSCQLQRRREEEERRREQKELQMVEEYERFRLKRERDVGDAKAKFTDRKDALEREAARRVVACRDAESAEAARAAAHHAAQEREKAQREREMQEKLAEERKRTQAHLLHQMKEKNKAKATEQERLRLLRDKQETDAQKYRDTERELAERRRARNIEHRSELERQMATRVLPLENGTELMTDSEMRINRPLIERATAV